MGDFSLSRGMKIVPTLFFCLGEAATTLASKRSADAGEEPGASVTKIDMASATDMTRRMVLLWQGRQVLDSLFG